MKRSLCALALSLIPACGGTTDANTTSLPDSSTFDANDASAVEATADTSPETLADQSSTEESAVEAQAETATDAPPWAACFDETDIAVGMPIKGCGTNGCSIKKHVLDCCGNSQWMGITAGKEAEFDACEAAWQASLGLCNCPAGIPKTEQPAAEVSDIAQVKVECGNCTMKGCVCLTSPK